MELDALIRVLPFDIGIGDLVEQTHRRDEYLGLDLFAIICFEAPQAGRFIEAGGCDFGAEADMLQGAMFGGTMIQISKDFRLGSVRRAPTVILLERIGIEPAWHVAGSAGILVVSPDAA